MKLPAKPPDGSVVALVDSREQRPFDLDPLPTEKATLQTGDYTIRGLEALVCVERKSLPDLVSCVGPDRERFMREIERIRGFPHKLLAVEATWDEIRAGGWRPNVTPSAVTGSLLSWAADGLPFLCLPRKDLQAEVSRFLVGTAHRRWRQLRAMAVEMEAVA